MKIVFILLLGWMGYAACAQEIDVNRDPAAVPRSYVGKRTYPGGMDEEDLQVQAQLPEAALKTDAHTVQRDVYKSLYKQEMKEERQETVEE
jgi:hypothetical protein